MTRHGKTATVAGSTSGTGPQIAEALAGAGANTVPKGFGEPEEIAALVACATGAVSTAGAVLPDDRGRTAQ